MPEDYLLFVIILTVIGFIVTTAFYVYFVYLPAARAEAQIDVIEQKGSDLITLVNNQITNIENTTIESLQSLCDAFFSVICDYNHNPSTNPCGNVEHPRCVLDSQAYPAYCNQFRPFPANPCDCVV